MSTTTRITLEQYDEMIARGDFEPSEEHQVELLYGEISPMSPINPPHDYTVDQLNEWSFEVLPPRAVWVRVQGAFGIPVLDSAPQPDLAWLRRKPYTKQRPTPADVLLVIEVADSSLAKDRGPKARLYAEAGIADYWIVNLQERSVEVRRDPQGSSYRSLVILKPGDEARPLAFPAVALDIDRLFPTDQITVMRIVSLLPSLTELVAALGHRADLVGVTHECDFPPEVVGLPVLTRSRIDCAASSGAIDTLVAGQGSGLYELDGKRLEQLQPDLVLTQAQCDVCAVNEATVRRLAAELPQAPAVESVNPARLADVHAMFRRIGDLLGARAAADRLVAGFEATAAVIARRRAERPRRRAILLEWFDPPYSSGHWNPELIALAGGVEVIARPGARSRRVSWEEVTAAGAEIIVLAPCGFTLERSEAELPALLARPEWSRLAAVQAGAVVLADGSAYFSRPGPRLEASLRIAAAAIDPDDCGDLAPATGWRRLPATPMT